MWHDENVFLLAEFGSVSVCLLEHFQVIFMSRYILTLLALVAVGKKTLLSWSFWLWMLSYPGISCLWCHWWFDYLSSLRQFSWADVYSHWLHLLLMIKRLSSVSDFGWWGVPGVLVWWPLDCCSMIETERTMHIVGVHKKGVHSV